MELAGFLRFGPRGPFAYPHHREVSGAREGRWLCPRHAQDGRRHITKWRRVRRASRAPSEARARPTRWKVTLRSLTASAMEETGSRRPRQGAGAARGRRPYGVRDRPAGSSAPDLAGTNSTPPVALDDVGPPPADAFEANVWARRVTLLAMHNAATRGCSGSPVGDRADDPHRRRETEENATSSPPNSSRASRDHPQPTALDAIGLRARLVGDDGPVTGERLSDLAGARLDVASPRTRRALAHRARAPGGRRDLQHLRGR